MIIYMISLKDKISIITGGSRGIGSAIAHLFARAGINVHIFDIDEARWQKWWLKNSGKTDSSLTFMYAMYLIINPWIQAFKAVRLNESGTESISSSTMQGLHISEQSNHHPA
jgi:hypothetical protein